MRRNTIAWALMPCCLSLFPVSTCTAASGDIYNVGTWAGAYSAAYGVNVSGQVVGLSWLTAGTPHAFLYSGMPGSSGAMTDLGTLGGEQSAAYGVNVRGQVVGQSYI